MPTCCKFNLNPRHTLVIPKPTEGQLRTLTAISSDYMTCGTVAMNLIYQRSVTWRFAFDKCPVNFSDISHPKLLRQPLRRFGGQREHNDARCRSVKAMDKAQINIAGLIELIFYIFPGIIQK